MFVLGCGSFALGQQTITLLEKVQIEGTVKTVGPGVITVTDSAGKDTEFKIQPKDEKGIPLSGTQAVIDFPAQVEVRGELKPESLTPGTLVRFTGKVNRLGRTDGDVDQIVVFDEKRYELGLQVVKEAKERSGYAECTIAGDVFSCRDNRLVVTVPKTEYCAEQPPRVQPVQEREDFVGERQLPPSEEGGQGHAVAGGEVLDRRCRHQGTDHRSHGRRGAATAGGIGRSEQVPAPVRRTVEAARRAVSPHFLLHTDVSDRNAQILLDTLETMIVLVSNYFGRPPAGILECYVVRDLQQWPPGLIPPEGVAKISEPAGVTLSVRVGQLGQVHRLLLRQDRRGAARIGARLLPADLRRHGTDVVRRRRRRDGALLEERPAGGRDRPRGHQLPEELAAEEDAGHRGRRSDHRRFMASVRLAVGLVPSAGQQPELRGPLQGLGHRPDEPAARLLVRERVRPDGAGNLVRVRLLRPALGQRFSLRPVRLAVGPQVPVLAGQGYVTVKVAAKYGWQATGVKLAAGQAFDYAAKGHLEAAVRTASLTADGDADGQGRLAGIIMKEFSLGEPFDLGTRGTCTAPQEGDLYLRCRDGWNQIGDNDGTISVHLRKSPVP